MKRDAPPFWMEWMLLLCVEARERGPISGDLLEEYREQQLPRLGLAGADVWYLRQVVSFALIRMAGGLFMRGTLVAICAFNVVASTWLGVMEQVLRHQGYAGRSAMAVAIAAQALLTIAAVLLKRSWALRHVTEIGAVAILALGASALYKIAMAEHFEGFVMVIGAALMLQGVLTLMTLLPRRYLPVS